MAHAHRQRARGRKPIVRTGSRCATGVTTPSRPFERQALNLGLELLECRRMLSVTTDAQGWTVFGRSADTRVVFVSSSTGDDANSGLQEDAPVRSLAKAKSLLRSGAPDWMLLKRGDTWSENLTSWNRSGRDADEMMVIGAYGAGARPKLNTGSTTGFNNNGNPIAHLAIVGIHFHAHTRDTANPDYDGTIVGDYGFRSHGKLHNILIEDAVFDDYVFNLSVTGFDQRITDFTLRRSIMTDAWSTDGKAQGMYVSKVDGIVLEENVFDHNGWNESIPGAGANIFSHGIYMSGDNTGVVMRGNTIANSGSHGVQARSGGIIEDNLLLRNPINLLFGGGAPLVKPGGVEGRVVGNVFLDSRSIAGSLRGTGLELSNLKPGAEVVVASNIFTADTHRASAAITFGLTSDAENLSESMGINDLTIQGNIVYDWHSAWNLSSSFRPGQPGYRGVNNLEVVDNDFQNTAVARIVRHGPKVNTNELYWENNRYENEFSPNGWFQVDPDTRSFEWWKANAEPTAVRENVAYADPSRSIGLYNASIGGEGTFEAFIAVARTQERRTQDDRYTAAAVINYVREGFAEGGIVPGGVATTYGPEEKAPTPVDDPPTDSADLTAPTAALSVSPAELTTPGTANHPFTVKYTDESAIDISTIATGDLRVTGPNGFSQNVVFISRTTPDSKTANVVYGIRAPGGYWDTSDNGTYTLSLVAGAVRDTLGNASAASADFGTFTVDVPPDTAPPAITAELPPDINAGTVAPQTFTLTYSDETGVNLSTIGTGDVIVTFPGGSAQPATYLSRQSSNNDKTVVAVYSLAAPGGEWDAADNGEYQVALASGAVADLSGRSTPGRVLGTFAVDVAPPADTTAPTVTDVFVGGSGWSQSFRTFLGASGAGEAAFGYRIVAAEQTDELPWTNLDQISIRFSENVDVSAHDLVVRGVSVSRYDLTPAGDAFTYDPATSTATWTLAAPIAQDKILLDLNDDVADANGNALDGEWSNPVAPLDGGADDFPSGDGLPGGDFQFRMNVLPGDVNRTGGVLGSDVTLVRNAQGFAPGTGLYALFKDVNGSGGILGSDVTLVRNRQGSSLPAGEPAAL